MLICLNKHVILFVATHKYEIDRLINANWLIQHPQHDVQQAMFVCKLVWPNRRYYICVNQFLPPGDKTKPIFLWSYLLVLCQRWKQCQAMLPDDASQSALQPTNMSSENYCCLQMELVSSWLQHGKSCIQNAWCENTAARQRQYGRQKFLVQANIKNVAG